MSAETRVTVRDRYVVESVSPRLMEILDAMDRMSEAEAAAYWDRLFPSPYGCMVDRDLAGPCADCVIPLCTCDMPTDEMIDRAIALRRTGQRPTLDECHE